MNNKELQKTLRLHKLWLENSNKGKRADLSGANLYKANLSGVYLCSADLSEANLSRANLSRANLSGVNLSGTNLYRADLSRANLSGVNLSEANLHGADLTVANLYGANLYRANLSEAKLLSQIEFLEKNFEKDTMGYIVYKTFGEFKKINQNWKIIENSIITETVDFNRTNTCGSGVNIATKEWILENTAREVWKCRIRYEWLAGVCVPYNTDGKIRAEKVEILERVSREEMENDDYKLRK